METEAAGSAVRPYRETQWFSWWVYALLASIPALMWYIAATLPDPANILFRFVGTAVTLFSITLTVFMLRLNTEVTDAALNVWFGWVPSIRRIVPIGEVRSIEVVRYHPLAEWGGWGYRLGRKGDLALNARGNRGVMLHLAKGTRLLIGSQRPEALAEALRSRMIPEQA